MFLRATAITLIATLTTLSHVARAEIEITAGDDNKFDKMLGLVPNTAYKLKHSTNDKVFNKHGGYQMKEGFDLDELLHR